MEFDLRTDTVYLGNGNIDYVIDVMDETTDYVYDPLGRLDSITDPLMHQTIFNYDANGNRTSMMDAENVVTHYEYDAVNRLITVIENYQASLQPDHQTNIRTEYSYDAAGNRRTILDGRLKLSTLEYDEFGRLAIETDALGNDYFYDYNAIGNRISILDPNGETTSFEYDELNRLGLIDYPGSGEDVTFEYDALGRRLNMNDAVGETSWDYMNLNLPKNIQDPFLSIVSYDYDPLGNKVAVNYPNGRQVQYDYDTLNRLEDVISNGVGSTHYEYDAAGRLKATQMPNGVNSAYDYEDNGWLKTITHSLGNDVLASYQYHYDNVGNRTQTIETVPFLPSEFTLSINVIGNGSIARSSEGPYQPNSVVTLTPTADPGWTFTGWSSECAGTDPCSVTMTVDKTITATFTQDEYTLNITSEHGTASKTPDQATYHYGDVVQLQATPAEGWTFTNWTGGA
ncbi:MAG: hypothetical protein JNM00_02520, partial [Flavobacteriales bacterium]|nr:hypothetical protein [Flavobacteriales bacterium]